mmetsp:Transcript_107627/g.160981  ORF Transcript_107627/g.160981 Transcript_107627/m.160981 type:complete len:132 (+) Transcript_107627:173-568(+)
MGASKAKSWSQETGAQTTISKRPMEAKLLKLTGAKKKVRTNSSAESDPIRRLESMSILFAKSHSKPPSRIDARSSLSFGGLTGQGCRKNVCCVDKARKREHVHQWSLGVSSDCSSMLKWNPGTSFGWMSSR